MKMRVVEQEIVKASKDSCNEDVNKISSATTFHPLDTPIATYKTAGKVKPDGRTISVTEDGTITAFDADKTNGHTVNTDVPEDALFTDTTYENEPAVQGGTDVSLVTTGNKFYWNNKVSQSDRLTNSDIDDIIK